MCLPIYAQPQDVLKICRAVLVRRRSDRDEENVGRCDRRGNVSREAQTPVLLVSLDQILETGS